MSRILGRTEMRRRAFSQRFGNQSQDANDPDQRTVERSAQGFVQDQVILVPEIMSKILGQLDVHTLKKVRLVCKSWLREAQPHMERRGIVWLGANKENSTRFPEFIETREHDIPSLPQPFMSLDVDLNYWMKQPLPHQQVLNQMSRFIPPLLITRFTTAGLQSALAVQLIIESCSSLEYLKLYSVDNAERFQISQKNQNLNIPKLQHLALETRNSVSMFEQNWVGFPPLVSWITGASPSLDTFEICVHSGTPEELVIGVLLGVDIGNLKTLKLRGEEGLLEAAPAVLNHFASIQFIQLQNLEVSMINGFGEVAADDLLMTIAVRVASTLRSLDLRECLGRPEETGSLFPVCPNVVELRLDLFSGWNDFVSRCFPSLKRLCVEVPINNGEYFPGGGPPFVGVNSLTLLHTNYCSWSFGPMEVFTTFPALECLRIHESYLLEYYRKKKSIVDDPGFVDLLQGLRSLELDGSLRNWFDSPSDAAYSIFAELKGVETLTVNAELNEVMKIPVEEMPSLKVLRFPWGSRSSFVMEKLFEISRSVRTVVITNCCSLRREGDSPSKVLLDWFFDGAPNAICGCKELNNFTRFE